MTPIFYPEDIIMAIKMRILYYPEKGKLKSAAELIKAEYTLSVNAVDTIPPAYSCNNERLVILALSVKGDADDTLRRFLLELTKARAQNVAIIHNGNDAGLAKVKEYLTTAGAKIVGESLNMDIGLFSGKKLSDDEKSKVLDWTRNIVASLN